MMKMRVDDQRWRGESRLSDILSCRVFWHGVICFKRPKSMTVKKTEKPRYRVSIREIKGSAGAVRFRIS